MAKNTSSSAFRKIDVDQYNEDNFVDDDVIADANNTAASTAAAAAAAAIDEAEIGRLLAQGKNVDALKLALQNAPLSSRDQAVKDAALAVILRVILSIKSLQMDQALDALAGAQLLDVLMKYIYRGFEMPSEGSSGQLLQWHEKVFARGGIGCINRVLCDTHRA